MNNKVNCINCVYFSKFPGIRNYFVFTCHYWGLRCINHLPQLVVFESIGKKCPFFKEKNKEKNKKEKIPKYNNSDFIEFI